MVTVAWRDVRSGRIIAVAGLQSAPGYTLGIGRDQGDGNENYRLLNPQHPLISFYSGPRRYGQQVPV
jgi:hypothetical protein